MGDWCTCLGEPYRFIRFEAFPEQTDKQPKVSLRVSCNTAMLLELYNALIKIYRRTTSKYILLNT